MTDVAEIAVIDNTAAEEKLEVQKNNNYVQNGEATQVKSYDELAPAEDLWTTKIDAAVKLRIDETGPASDKPKTIMTMFEETAKKIPTHLALAVKRGGSWNTWNYKEYLGATVNAAKSFIKVGLEPLHSVGILGFNAPEWMISNLGAIYAGGMAVGIYATNTPEACEYVLDNSSANVVVVENHIQLQKILKVWDNLPKLKAIVQYTGEVAERRDNIYSWKEFMDLSSQVTDAALQERMNNQAPNKAAVLVYTSGTTGNPKGVMLSHDNVTWVSTRGSETNNFKFAQEITVSYLPLSHIAGALMDIYGAIFNGFSIYFAQPDALKGTLKDTLIEVRPTFFMGVPRVWEKFMEKLLERSKEVTGLKKKIGAWAKKKGKEGVICDMNHRPKPRFWGLANKLFFTKVKGALGLDRCRSFMTGAAPTSKEVLEYFYQLDVKLYAVYGMSECSGPHCFEFDGCFKTATVGKEIAGVQTKIADTREDGSGELCMWGRHVFMGYLNNEEKTRETIDTEGWLRSGDLAIKDNEGFVAITGRIKELLITAGGENVAPVPIEDVVKEELSVVSNCMLIGDKRKFLSMLITLKTVLNVETGQPTDDLMPEALDWCKANGCSATTVSQILEKNDENLFKAIQNGINKANEKAVSRAAVIQKWSILPRDFSIFGGELGPTMKLKRPAVMKMYEKTIDAFYAET